MRIWGKAEERGVILGAIAAIIFFVFIHPDPDVDLAVKYPGNPPYGTFWFALNPFYWTKQLYPIVVFIEWACITLIQYYLVRKKILYRNVFLLQILSVMFLFMIHAEQDVTVIMFAPFASLTIWFTAWEILQKIPAYGSDQWTCAFNGGGLASNAYQNPCLSTSTKFFIFSTHIYSLTYILLVFWALYPLLFWAKSSGTCQRMSARARKFASGRGGRDCFTVAKGYTLKHLWVDCETKRYCAWCGRTEKVERRGVEKPRVVDPPIRTQTSTPLPTEKIEKYNP